MRHHCNENGWKDSESLYIDLLFICKYILWIYSFWHTHTLAHTNVHTITQGERSVVTLTLWHISCDRLFGGKGVIKEKVKQTPKIYNPFTSWRRRKTSETGVEEK